MATLTETAYVSRKGINLGVILVIAIIILRIVLGGFIGIWQRIFPPPPPPATVAFGKLPLPSAQNNVATPSGTTYTLETVDNSLPTIPKIMAVYFMPHSGANFGSFDKMKALAARLGFQADSSNPPKKTGSTSWRFTDSNNPLRSLDIDELSGNFRLTYNFLSDLSLFNEKNFSSVESVMSSAQSFFSNAGVFSNDLSENPPTVTFFKLDSGALIPTTSLSNAEAISVSFARSNIDKIPVVSPDPKQGLVSVLLSGSSDQGKKAIDGRYFYSQIDSVNFATYPVISAKEAFDKLKASQAIFASLPIPMVNAVSIRKVYLAYLDPYPPQSYLQPVLVFSDEKGFIAYIPLVSPNWLGQ